MARTELAVSTHGLTKHFGRLVAVDAVDLEIPTGTVTALLGPNGAGKTTMVRMLATLSAPSGGTASVCGYDVVREADSVRRCLSLTGQFAALEPNLTARENLVLIARLRGHRRPAALRIVGRLIDRFDIAEFEGTLIKSVSGGQRRRVDLAASLVTEPRLLVLDEPTTGLDPRSRQVVWATVRELVGEGVTVLLSTQYLEEADELADQVVVMDHGRAVATGTSTELKAQTGDQRVDVTATDDAGYEHLRLALGARFACRLDPERRTVSVPALRGVDDLLAVTEEVVATGVAIDDVALRRPTLDDTFFALTGRPAEVEDSDELEEVSA
jgi:ABC-type multidrug transport system ATPase subunit